MKKSIVTGTARLNAQLRRKRYWVIDIASKQFICTTTSKRVAIERAKESLFTVVVHGTARSL